MLTSALALLLATTVGQAAASTEASWLTSVPADAEVVVRVRGVDAVRDDLIAMIRAMSPTVADQAEPAINGLVEQMSRAINVQATQTPILAVFKAVAPGQGEAPPFAVIVEADDYQGVLTALNQGRRPELKKVDGLDSFAGPTGDTVFAARGAGFVTFGIDSSLVGGIAKPGDRSLADVLSPELSERFLVGDVGLYLNMAVLTDRYSEEIDAAREQIVAAMEQAGEQMGNQDMMEGVGAMYGRAFDAIKVADGFALHFDFDSKALDVAGEVTVKPDSEAAQRLADSQTGSATELARMPADAAYFVYMNVNPSTFAGFQQMGMSMMFGGGDVPAAMKEALKLQQDVGRVVSVGASTVSKGMRTINVMTADDPQKLVEMTVASQKAMGDAEMAGVDFIKGVEVAPEAESFQGYSFTRSTVTFDLDALAGAQPNNPMATEMMKGMFGGESITTWTGTDGKTVLSVVAPDWDEAKAQIQTYLAGDQGIGATAGYQQVRGMLPDQANVLFLMSAQGLVRQLATQFSAMFGAELEPPGDMPKAPALLGFALATTQKGYQFQMVVPSPVGPVIEKGLVPLFMGLQGQVQQ